MNYNIYAGLGGGFSGATYQGTGDFENLEEAETVAYESACQDYESMEGYHGLETYEDCFKQAEEENPEAKEEVLAEIADEIYNENRENWIEYYAILTEEDEETDIEDTYEY